MILPVPNDRSRPAYRLNRSTSAATSPGLQGSAMPQSTGGTVTTTTYREIVACPGSARLRVRILTATATGTLNLKPVAPVATSSTDESVIDKNGFIDPAKVVIYTTGTATASVSAGTECKVDLDCYGENYVLVEFVCSLAGSIVWCDISQV